MHKHKTHINTTHKKTALVISGGGSKGAYAGGIVSYLMQEQGKSYDILVGSSVGSLMIGHLALNNIAYVKEVFATTTNKDVFSNFPFIVKQKDGKLNVKINHLNSLRAFIRKKPTFGESLNLRKLISKIYPEEIYNRIKKTNKKVVFSVSNLSLQRVEYKSTADNSYQDFCDWMWASANYVPFMSLLQKNSYQYADGGFGSLVPVAQAIEAGASEIDVIILSNLNPKSPVFSNPFQTILGIFQFMSHQIGINDLLIAELKGAARQIDINLWIPPEKITDFPLIFDPKQMMQWWQNGYDYAQNTAPECYCYLPSGDIVKK